MKDTPPAKRVFLVGFMGSRKTAVGKALARKLDHEFVDTDELIEEQESRSIEEIFAGDGEARFRQLEKETLEKVAGGDRLVVATGGGLFLQEDSRRLVQELGTSVWLDTPLEILWRRCRDQGGRPLFGELPRMRDLLEKRRPAYEQADYRIAAGSRSVGEIVEEICELLEAGSTD